VTAAHNPDQPIVLTDDPGNCEAEYKAKGFRLMNLYVLKFYPAMQTDLLNQRKYGLQFYRRAPEPQLQLL
jgi:hypothetical protein